MTELTTPLPVTEHGARWKWFLALGVLLVLLGLAGAGATTLLKLTSLVVFGPLLMASGIIQVVIAFFSERGKDFLLHLVAAGVEALLGYLITAFPLEGMIDLAVLIAVFLVVTGLLRLARWRVTPSVGRGWTFMAGAAALILGICVWLKLPVSGLWAVGLCIALDFICHGVSWSAVALAERKPLQPPAH